MTKQQTFLNLIQEYNKARSDLDFSVKPKKAAQLIKAYDKAGRNLCEFVSQHVDEIWIGMPNAPTVIVKPENKAKVTWGRKCAMCGERGAENAWQPFGPSLNCRDDPAFMAPGFHTRGFPVFLLCDDCKGNLRNGEDMSFNYKGERWYCIGETLGQKSRMELGWD